MFSKSAFCKFTVALVAVAALNCSVASAIELTTNGGFETGDFTGWSQFDSGVGQQTITSVNPFSGTYAVSIDNVVEASNSLIKQANIGVGVVAPGQTVNISFAARGRYGIGGVAFAELFSEVDGGGVSKSEILGNASLAINADPEVWTPFNFTTTAGPDVSGGVTLQLGATNGAVAGESTQMWYDQVSVSVIPEPASAALLGLGGLAMLLRRRR